jgi:stress-induced-phosphoprotein 1
MATFKDQGNAAFKNKDYTAAVELYTKALTETPNEHTILGNRAAALHNMQKYNDALLDAEKCIAIKPDWSKGYQRKAMAQQAMGDLEAACENYSKAVEIDPANVQAKTMNEACEKQQLQQMMGGM